MSSLAELKPILAALVLPPVSLLLLAGLGLFLATARTDDGQPRPRVMRVGRWLIAASLALLWLLGVPRVADALSDTLVPHPRAVRPEQLAGVQAIVILGGGVLPFAPEYDGFSQPGPVTLSRLRYGIWLAKRTGKPVAFAGGIGWSASGVDTGTEGAAAMRAAQDFDFRLTWVDHKSRDTAENAAEMQRLLQPQGIRRIALVSDAWHLPRATVEFERAGFTVLQAPTGSEAGAMRFALTWLPSVGGWSRSHTVLREAMGLALQRLR